jgi:hypothetical protein
LAKLSTPGVSKLKAFSYFIAKASSICPPPLMTSNRPNLWIFVDWDETITDHDTLNLIAPPDLDDPNGPPPFSFFSQYYMKLIAEHEEEFGPRDTLERQLEYLDSMTSVENASVSKVEEHGLFKGVTNEDLYERGKQVHFRKGWEEFTKQVRKSPNARLLAILSVNWSTVFIEGALWGLHDEEFMKQLEIRANVTSVGPSLILER